MHTALWCFQPADKDISSLLRVIKYLKVKVKVKVKVKQSHYRPGQAQRIPGS